MIEEPHFTPQRLARMLGLKADSLGPYALIPGPKERSRALVEALEQRHKSFAFLDYEMHTGQLDGKRVTVGNGGRFAPDSAITTELLCAAGAEVLIRVGSCGSLQDDIKIGDLVIASGAIRGEGTTPYYVPESFSTIADPEVVTALQKASEGLKVACHVGWVYTTDALFQETPELIQQLNAQRVAAIDMVSSAFLTVARVRSKRAGAILAVSDECLRRAFGFRDPRFADAEEKMVEVARRALQYL